MFARKVLLLFTSLVVFFSALDSLVANEEGVISRRRPTGTERGKHDDSSDRGASRGTEGVQRGRPIEEFKETGVRNQRAEFHANALGRLNEELPPDAYDVWGLRWNCHTWANHFVERNPTAQIIDCNSTVDPRRDAGGHTPVLLIRDGQACVYDQTRTPCCSTAVTPFKFQSPEVQRCVKEACANQYSGSDTELLAAGELVEFPGPNVCLRAVRGLPVNSRNLPARAPNRQDMGDCQRCCLDRADMWREVEDLEGTYQTRNAFLHACRSQCSKYFRPD